MSNKRITGIVTYLTLGAGFWGIIDEDGNEWRPDNMPEQLKKEGKKVTLKVTEIVGEMSIFMWGTPVHIVSFHT